MAFAPAQGISLGGHDDRATSTSLHHLWPEAEAIYPGHSTKASPSDILLSGGLGKTVGRNIQFMRISCPQCSEDSPEHGTKSFKGPHTLWRASLGFVTEMLKTPDDSVGELRRNITGSMVYAKPKGSRVSRDRTVDPRFLQDVVFFTTIRITENK